MNPEMPNTVPQNNLATTTPSPTDPGKTLGIVSLVLAFMPLLGLFGVITGIIAKKRSKKAGHSNGLALVGIILSAINIAVMTPLIAILIFTSIKLVQKCSELGPGVHYSNGATYTCGKTR